MVEPGEEIVFVVLVVVGGLRFGSAAGTGAGAHGTGALVPPANSFGGSVQGCGIGAPTLFVTGLGRFGSLGVIVGTHTGGAGARARMVVPPPIVGGDDRERAQGGQKKCAAEGKNQSLHRVSPSDVSSM